MTPAAGAEAIPDLSYRFVGCRVLLTTWGDAVCPAT